MKHAGGTKKCQRLFLQHCSEVPSGFEPENKGFADLKYERRQFVFYARSSILKTKEPCF